MSNAGLWQRVLARMYFAWGQSCAYWGNKTVSPRLYRWAVGAFDRALGHAPGWNQAQLRRAVVRGRELDDYTGAVRDLTAIIERDSEWAEPYLQRGLFLAYHGLAAAPQAIHDLERFLYLDARHSWRGEAEHLLARLRAELAERSDLLASAARPAA